MQFRDLGTTIHCIVNFYDPEKGRGRSKLVHTITKEFPWVPQTHDLADFGTPEQKEGWIAEIRQHIDAIQPQLELETLRAAIQKSSDGAADLLGKKHKLAGAFDHDDWHRFGKMVRALMAVYEENQERIHEADTVVTERNRQQYLTEEERKSPNADRLAEALHIVDDVKKDVRKKLTQLGVSTKGEPLEHAIDPDLPANQQSAD